MDTVQPSDTVRIHASAMIRPLGHPDKAIPPTPTGARIDQISHGIRVRRVILWGRREARSKRDRDRRGNLLRQPETRQIRETPANLLATPIRWNAWQRAVNTDGSEVTIGVKWDPWQQTYVTFGHAEIAAIRPAVEMQVISAPVAIPSSYVDSNEILCAPCISSDHEGCAEFATDHDDILGQPCPCDCVRPTFRSKARVKYPRRACPTHGSECVLRQCDECTSDLTKVWYCDQIQPNHGHKEI